MTLEALRRFLLENLMFNLASLLGIAQLGIAAWLFVVADAQMPSLAWWIAGAVLLVAANTLALPAIRRARLRADGVGVLSRLYMKFGIGMLLVASGLAALTLTWVVFGTVLEAIGITTSSEVYRALSIALVAATAGGVLWGFTFGQSRVDYTGVRIPIPDLHEDLHGLRIVQLSDLHIGNGLEGERLTRMVERANELDPDVIVLTGDVFDFDPDHVEDGVRRLAGLRARHGVYAVLGNHDAFVGAELVAGAFARLAPELRLLRDEVHRLPVPHPLYIAGVEDPGFNWSRRGVELEGLEVVAAARPDDGPTLLLVHRPEAFSQAARHGFPLVLSGHTHGGQLALPLRGGQINLARVMSRFTRGIYQHGGTILYVNRGIGVAGPAIRIGCRREIATVELVAGSQLLFEDVDQAGAPEADLLVGAQRGAVGG